MSMNNIPWFGTNHQEGLSARSETPGTTMPLLTRYWRVVFCRRWIVLAIVSAVLLLGLLATLLTTPKYTASATLEIARQQDRVVEVNEVTPESDFVDQEFYQTQYSLLEARSLAEAVSTKLRLPQNDEFFAMFDVDPDKDTLFSQEVDGATLTRDQRENRQREAVEILLDHIGIAPTRGSRLVTVSFTSPDPEFSVQVVNTWTETFIEQTLSRRYEANSYARDFLEGRLGDLRERLEQSERDVVAYAEREEIINLPTGVEDAKGNQAERSIIVENLAALNKELTEATADRIAAGSRNSTRPDVAREALTNQAITGLRQNRAEVAAEYARLLAQFEPSYPPVQALAAQLKKLDESIAVEEARIRRSLGTDYASASKRESELKSRVEALKNDLLDQRQRSIQYNIFQREADTNRQLYDALLQRYKEIGVAGGVGSNNIAVIDPAQAPDEPTSPKIVLNMLLSLLAGLGLGVAIAFLLEQIDEAVRDPSDLDELTGLPLLGVIPRVERDEDPLEALADLKSPQSEAYLSVKTNLQFATDHGAPRSLTATSTRASEGKSTTALAIAQSLARSGKSVVLMDCDLRSPSVHKLLGKRNEFGVSNFLSGDDDIERMMHQSDHANLTYVTAGPQPPNSGELLSSNRLDLLLARFGERFDHVVIDSPPVLGLADALIVGSKVEAVIYAVEANSARRGMIRSAINRLRQVGIMPLGVVLTKYDARKAQYGYGYDYGYSYGEKDAVA